MTGPLAVLDDEEDGVRSLFRMEADLAEMTLPMTAAPAILRANIKSYPCLATGQGAAAAGIEMHKKLKGKTADIEHIDVIMADYPFIRRQQDDQKRRFPNSREAADHSFYFIAAVAILDGELTPRQFDNERWTDPKVKDLMQKIAMKADKALNARAPKGYPCSIRIVHKGGAEHVTEVGYAPGYSSEKGLNAAVVAEKFDAITRKALNDSRRRAVKEAVERLDAAPSVSGLMDLLGR
jgi:2-methylcitrate dehydratase